MPKVWWTISQARPRRPNNEGGFSVVEVLLAATVFGFLVTALIGAVIYGRSATASSGDRVRAQFLAEEAIDAVRSIGNSSYANLTPLVDGTSYGLQQTGSPLSWSFKAAGTTDVIDIYTRQVIMTTVSPTRKTATVNVTWPQAGGTTGTVTLSTRMTNWKAAVGPSGPTMMVYSKTTTTPFYRTWNGTVWSAEGSASAVVGNINYIVLKTSRTRNEAILGTQTSTGAIYVQVWNGTTWGAATLVGTGSTTTRSFDLAYEKNGDRAVIVYAPTAASADFAYRIWDGTTLSAATTITTPPTTGVVNWIELRQNPLFSSSEIAMIMLDANADVYGMIWTGTAWSSMGTTAVWDATAATATKKTIDVEYEQTSGKAMFMWGDSVATDQYYRTWDGTTLGVATLLDIPAEGGIAEWIQLAARPNSNEIMMGVQDAAANLNTRKWSGSAWDTATQHVEHSALVENITSRVFDIIWETHTANPGKAWLMWGDSATVTKKQWSAGAWGAGSVLTTSDDTSFIRLRADPVSGAIFAGLYEDFSSATGDIWESRLTGGGTVWTAKNTIWAGPTAATPVFFRIDITTP